MHFERKAAVESVRACSRTNVVCAALVLCFSFVVCVLGQGQTHEYVVGAHDVLLVTVFNQPDLSGKFEVEADGFVEFPLISRVKVAGLTTREVERALFSKLSPAFFRNPQIAVSIDAHRSQQFSVLGEVNSPGTFFLTGDETLIKALARAGSTKVDAGDEVLIVRSHGPASGVPVLPDQADAKDIRRVSLSLLSAGDLTQNLAIADGDTIFVRRADSVFILGQVRTPGPYRYTKTLTILQLLSMAGGATDRGATNRIQIIRTANGKKQEIKASLSDRLLPNDTIIVPEKFF